MKLGSWRALLSLIVLLCGIVYALPNLPFIANTPIAQYLPNSKISLGLDLKGGVSLTLGVQVDKALESLLASSGQDIKDTASNENINILTVKVIDNKLELVLPKAQDADKFNTLLAQNFNTLAVDTPETGANNELIYRAVFTPEHRLILEDQILEQAVQTIRNRIDQFGVAEPDIRKQADNRIQIQLPGLSDPQRAIQLLGQTASLSFHLVRDDIPSNTIMLPPGTAYFPMLEGTGQVILDSTALMTGSDITDARPSFDDRGQVHVSLTFNNIGAAQFERITGENVNRRMAIVLDGTVYSAPVINEKITGGRASISGSTSVQEAQDLSIILRAGALPAPVEVLEERTVGPSLGQESITSGLLAALVGALLVIIIMPLYYGTSGFIADVMLCFTMLLVTAGLGAFGATLTLPGIAGIVLTIGMSVDANVLIYERIREEINNGLSALEAVQVGFSRASISIMDSNITTLIAAIILYQFGTGPVRGFAVTLGIGILSSMFTAVFVSREIFISWMSKNDGKNISI